MAILSPIQRDTNNGVSIVRMLVNDSLSQVTSINYISNNQSTINKLNNGVWQWYITDMVLVAANNGNQFCYFSDDSFSTLIESNEIVNKSAFSVGLSNDQAVSNNSDSKIIFDNISTDGFFDEGNNFSVTNNYFLCPIDGIYIFSVFILLDSDPTVISAALYINRNDTYNKVYENSSGFAGAQIGINGISIMKCFANDRISVILAPVGTADFGSSIVNSLNNSNFSGCFQF